MARALLLESLLIPVDREAAVIADLTEGVLAPALTERWVEDSIGRAAPLRTTDGEGRGFRVTSLKEAELVPTGAFWTSGTDKDLPESTCDADLRRVKKGMRLFFFSCFTVGGGGDGARDGVEKGLSVLRGDDDDNTAAVAVVWEDDGLGGKVKYEVVEVELGGTGEFGGCTS